MNKLLAPALIVSSLLLAACAQTRSYTPAVDSRMSSPEAAMNLERDLQECEALAKQAAGNTAVETAIGTGVGGAIGAGTGAAIGAITGNAGRGAAIGAVAGGVGGGAKEGFESDSKYKRAYRDCLRGRGHRVID
jgi:outer membrane lipoprotein SlyB